MKGNLIEGSLPRLRSTTPAQSTSRPSLFRFHYDDMAPSSPPAIRRRSPSPLQRRPQEPDSPQPYQPSFSSTNLPYDPFKPLEPPITVFRQPSTSLQSSTPTRQHSINTLADHSISNDPTSPISSAEAASPPDKRPKSPSPIALPSDRSRKRSDISSVRAHRQVTKPLAAPIIQSLLQLHVWKLYLLMIQTMQHQHLADQKSTASTPSQAAGKLNLTAKSKIALRNQPTRWFQTQLRSTPTRAFPRTRQLRNSLCRNLRSLLPKRVPYQRTFQWTPPCSKLVSLQHNGIG